MIKVPFAIQYRLRLVPEYAMGYQLGVAKLSTGDFQAGFVLNGASFATRDELSTLSPYDLAKAEAAALKSNLGILDFTLIPRPMESLKNVRRVYTAFLGTAQKTAQFSVANESYRTSKGAVDASFTYTRTGDIFMRFSAYPNDFRITEKRALTPGTFATTKDDAAQVKSGREAISRYALENKRSANNRFTITPKDNTKLQEGIVQPAYGEAGGGVEVIFVRGTTDWTVSQPEMLPE